MKKTFLARRNAIFSSASFSWGALALIFAVSLLLLRLIAPNFFWHVFTPIFNSANILKETSRAFISSFKSTAKLAIQNEKLADENFALTNENQTLLQKLNSVSGLVMGVNEVVAGVVARPPLSPYDTLVIAAGSNDNITLGMEAFGDGGVPLGIVSDVLPDFSRVTLFSSPGVIVNGWVGRASLPVTISGAGAGVMNASVSRSADIIVGDTVFAPGPGMLPIGNVVRADSDSSSSSVILRIMPLLNLFSVSWVTVRDTGISLP
jgi:cell shape-determining protein MreC